MNMKKNPLLCHVILVLAVCLNPMQTAVAAPTTMNMASAEDNIKINTLLSNYTRSVTEGDRKFFESQLLDLNIPFAGVASRNTFPKPLELKSVQDYASFRKGIFESGNKLQQRFSNIKIEQVGNLASVSLDFETGLQGTPYEGKGWKVLHLLKLNGEWKIVSEFYTGYPDT